MESLNRHLPCNIADPTACLWHVIARDIDPYVAGQQAPVRFHPADDEKLLRNHFSVRTDVARP